MLLTGNYVSIKIILRERRKIGNRLCYYVKTKGVLTNGGTLISDNFLYSSGNEVYHISSSYSEVNESKLSMISNKMIQSFKF